MNHEIERTRLEWLALYKERVERLQKFATFSAPVMAVARESALVLDAASHLTDRGLALDEPIAEHVSEYVWRGLKAAK